MSLALTNRTRLFWPPLKRAPHRPAAREYRVHRHDRPFDKAQGRRFERYWQRLMRRHRRFSILRRSSTRLTAGRLRYQIPSEFGDQGSYRLMPNAI